MTDNNPALYRQLCEPFASAEQAETMNRLAVMIHDANRRWWHTPEGEWINRNTGELLMLVVSEIAEAMEGHRKNLMDDHLPHRRMFEVELADAMIRIFDLAGAHGLDIGGALVEKLEYNTTRKDHTYEERMKEGGKKY